MLQYQIYINTVVQFIVKWRTLMIKLEQINRQQ